MRRLTLQLHTGPAAFVALLLLSQFNTAAAACQETLFSCETERTGKVIEICADPSETGTGWKGAQYRYGRVGVPELVFPQDATAGKAQLSFSHEQRGSEYRVSVRFSIAGYVYRVFSNSRGESEGSAGVSVSNKAGKLLSTVRCAERPQLFVTYLREALACDLDNPHGRLACNEDPFKLP
jgi:hypothetical protein